MIPNHILLPALSAKDRTELSSLSTAYERAVAAITAHNNDSRVARKRELREKMKTAPTDQLLSLGAELESLDSSYTAAKQGAKTQLRELGPRFNTLFGRLLLACDEHADGLIDKASAGWAQHFASFGATPTGLSPVVQFLQSWKQTLEQKSDHLDLIAAHGSTPPTPATFLPYSTKA